MVPRPVTDELVEQIAGDLRVRYALDDEAVRTLGERLAGDDRTGRPAENQAFGERFVAEHAATFARLAQ